MAKYQVTVSNGHCVIHTFEADNLKGIKRDITENMEAGIIYNVRSKGSIIYSTGFGKKTLKKI